MSARRARIVILCEDNQHEAFIRRFLYGMGWEGRDLRIEKSPSASGSAEQYIRELFPKELPAYRKERNKGSNVALIAMIDADSKSADERIGEIRVECESRQIPFLNNNDAVVIAIPRRNIETWIRHLEGEIVDETTTYPKLDKERNCKKAVSNLVDRCLGRSAIPIILPSLAAVCAEYKSRIKSLL
ncbi:MAG: hypothetical protein PHP45_01685 [Elusimicrobiales bacterium]|nr:hypothetical protein [Elusimicrobiales bacterium]